ncbi:VWA domain-containing protein [Streptomyces sp. NPDC058623]|uniref:VWA domain-containing protein n=1 Tax=Streptomyces sp. NPDC058623 TaxID=3346563 RepID=UPI00365CE058
MGIRSLLRKVFGRSAEPVPETSDAPSAALPSQTERTPLDVAAELVAASFDNPTVPPQPAPRDREPGTVMTAPVPATDPTVPEARRPVTPQSPQGGGEGPTATPAGGASPAGPEAKEPPAAAAEPAAEPAAAPVAVAEAPAVVKADAEPAAEPVAVAGVQPPTGVEPEAEAAVPAVAEDSAAAVEAPVAQTPADVEADAEAEADVRATAVVEVVPEAEVAAVAPAVTVVAPEAEPEAEAEVAPETASVVPAPVAAVAPEAEAPVLAAAPVEPVEPVVEPEPEPEPLPAAVAITADADAEAEPVTEPAPEPVATEPAAAEVAPRIPAPVAKPAAAAVTADADAESEPEAEPVTEPAPEPVVTEPAAAEVAPGIPAPVAEPVAPEAVPVAPEAVPVAAAAAVAAAVVRRRAPGVSGAYKAAGQVLRGKGRVGARAKVYLVLDRSGSMRGFYKDGSAQHLADHALALAAHLDERATVHTVFFSTEVDGTADLTLDAHGASWVEARHSELGRMGRTSYHAAVEAVLERYQKDGGEGPALVLFQTDGAPDNRQPARQALVDAATAAPDVRWQFVAFGDLDSKAFDFLRRLDAGNAGFFHAGPAPAALPPATLLKGLLDGF